MRVNCLAPPSATASRPTPVLPMKDDVRCGLLVLAASVVAAASSVEWDMEAAGLSQAVDGAEAKADADVASEHLDLGHNSCSAAVGAADVAVVPAEELSTAAAVPVTAVAYVVGAAIVIVVPAEESSTAAAASAVVET